MNRHRLNLPPSGGGARQVLTMHPQIIGRHHRMQMLERVIQHILSHDNVWITQMGAIADEFLSRQPAHQQRIDH